MLGIASNDPPIDEPAQPRQGKGSDEHVDLKAAHSLSLPSRSCAVTCRLIPPTNQASASTGHEPAGGVADPYKKLAVGATIAVAIVATPVLLIAEAGSFILSL
jgi:hypothetical protein